MAAATRALAEGGEFAGEWEDYHKDGSRIWIDARVARITDATGTPVGLMGLSHDISDRKRAEEARREYAERLQVLSRRVVEVQEEERRRLARELHDEIGQALTAIGINLQVLERSCGPEARPRLEDCRGVVRHTIEQVRGLALDLRPSMLDDLGLAAALRWLVDRQAQRAGFAGHFSAPSSEAPLHPDLATACYRIAQEALTNAVRHARARHVWVALEQDEAEVRLTIRDDGVGFDPGEARRRGARGASLGLVGIQERAEMLGGRVAVESEPGHGAGVRAWFPATSTPSSGGPNDGGGG
jgi:signal transduction histidine kinase